MKFDRFAILVMFLYNLQNIISERRLSHFECEEDPRAQPIFASLKEVVDLLESDKYLEDLSVQQLLYAYFNLCQSRTISYLPKPKRRPFIVVEGHHRTAKRILAMRLSRRIGASFLSNPPKCLMPLRNFYPSGTLLLRVYFRLCAYALAQNTRRLINIFPVVLNGYWLEQQIYAIAKTFGTNPPPEESPVYQWPKDLLKPDLMFFVEFPDNLHVESLTTRAPSEHKSLAMNALFRINIPDRQIIIINTTSGLDNVLQEMEDHIDKIIKPRFQYQWLNTTRGPTRFHLKNIKVEANKHM